MDTFFQRVQILSAAEFSHSPRTDDAQEDHGHRHRRPPYHAGYLPGSPVPLWVIHSAHTAIALGTRCGGWRIVHTVGSCITRRKPRGGFCSETAPSDPCSASKRCGGGAANIAWAWVLTIPAAVAWLAYMTVGLPGWITGDASSAGKS